MGDKESLRALPSPEYEQKASYPTGFLDSQPQPQEGRGDSCTSVMGDGEDKKMKVTAEDIHKMLRTHRITDT